MLDRSIGKLLTAPLDPSFAMLLIFVGVYSLIINSKQAAQQNFLRSARLSRIAGWCYILGGCGIFIQKIVSAL